MARKYYVAPSISTAGTETPADANFLKIYPKSNGLWYEQDSAGNEKLINIDKLTIPPIIAPAIVVHLNATNNTSTNAVTQNVVIPYDGDYMLSLSFNYNVDSNAAYGRFYATFDGNALDLNDRAADPQGNNQILVVEMKDNGNTAGGAITGTGSGNKAPFMMQYYLPGLTAGTRSFVLDVGCQTGGIETSIWNIIGDFKFIALT